MANIELIMKAFSFIEEHLDDDLQTETVAQACFASKSSLEKAFRFGAHFSVHDYVTRRRMMKAARLMIEKPEMSLLDVAVQYGYSSHEAFTRAFNQVWKCNPSEYREKENKKLHPVELFPPITGLCQIEGDNFMKKTVDISELYDFFNERKDCYFVVCDIFHLMEINGVSREAGDIAILESLRRMENCSGEEDVTFRIGADTFAVLTKSSDKAYAESILEKVMNMNGNVIPYEKKVPLSLYGTVLKIETQEKHITCSEFMNTLESGFEKFAQEEITRRG